MKAYDLHGKVAVITGAVKASVSMALALVAVHLARSRET